MGSRHHYILLIRHRIHAKFDVVLSVRFGLKSCLEIVGNDLYDAPLGFEPRLTAPKAVVLPLDEGAMWC